ncbi:hypothetical protein MICH65_0442 [Candidatus Chazhemtobacterium aquaticus]|uniref:Uncharacterized protein n=1 Tax=Candidatus Chazhemtobacterium aquaticus TaxID=2715735 RepID=A0A857N7W0_9BACT|nr:hypothetical protein MICH65_0442 [Candidatus Chazhemtobacterium aquaticus]
MRGLYYPILCLMYQLILPRFSHTDLACFVWRSDNQTLTFWV